MLTPEFAPETITYAVSTTDTKNKVTAATNDLTAVIEIKYDGVVKPNGKDITWTTGAKDLVIKVTDAEGLGSTTTYTVTVTKTE